MKMSVLRGVLAAVLLVIAPSSFAASIVFGCDSEACWADVEGSAPEPFRWEWTAYPAGSATLLGCGTSQLLCFYGCPGTIISPDGFVAVSVYDASNNLIGSDSQRVCQY